MYYFRGMAINLIHLEEILLDRLHDRDNIAPRLIKFLQIRSLLKQFRPELLMQLRRIDHGFLTQRNMIIKADYLYQITLLIFVLFELFFDDLLETIEDKLLDERWGTFFSYHELFIGLCVLLQSLHIKKGKGDMKFCWVRKLFYALLIHALYLNIEKLAVLLHFTQTIIFLRLFDFNWAIFFYTGLNMLLYIAN